MFIKIGFLLILTTKNSVLFHGSNSSIKSNSIDMPEGSILGSLLFLDYINDLCKCVKYSVITLLFTPIYFSHIVH